METLNKTFLAAFGNSYDLEIVNRKKAEELIENLDQEVVLEKLIKKHSTHGETLAYLNLESKEIEYHHFIGNTDLQQKGHLVLIESISGNLEEGLCVEDFLDDEELKNIGDAEPWDFIKHLNDYEDRIIEALKLYYNGFNDNSIDEQLDKIYNS